MLGVVDPPAALQIEVEPVAEHVAERLQRVLRLDALRQGISRVVWRLQTQVGEHPLGQHVVGQGLAPRASHGREQRAAQHEDLHEVVEMARLEARVLSVVGEGQELLGPLVEIGAGQVLERGQREDRGRGTPALAGQPRQLRELVPHGAVEAASRSGLRQNRNAFGR